MKTILKRSHLKKITVQHKSDSDLTYGKLEKSEMWGIVYANLQPSDLGIIIIYSSSSLLSIYPI